MRGVIGARRLHGASFIEGNERVQFRAGFRPGDHRRDKVRALVFAGAKIGRRLRCGQMIEIDSRLRLRMTRGAGHDPGQEKRGCGRTKRDMSHGSSPRSRISRIRPVFPWVDYRSKHDIRLSPFSGTKLRQAGRLTRAAVAAAANQCFNPGELMSQETVSQETGSASWMSKTRSVSSRARRAALARR